jgi:hypothetical protein
LHIEELLNALSAEYNWGDQIKECEMHGELWRDEKVMKNFSLNPPREETNRNIGT